MCLNCKGLGNQFEVSRKKIIPDDSVSIEKGGIAPLGEKKSNWGFRQMEVISKRYNFSLSDPIKKIPKEALEVILKGGNEKFSLASKALGITRDYKIDYEGIENFIKHQFEILLNTLYVDLTFNTTLSNYSISICVYYTITQRHIIRMHHHNFPFVGVIIERIKYVIFVKLYLSH